MAKSATTIKPRNFTMKFLECVIKEYISLDNYFSNHFLQLADFKEFRNRVVNRALLECKKLRDDPSKGPEEILRQIVFELPAFSERFGHLILKEISKTINENKQFFTSNNQFQETFSGNRLISEVQIHEKYRNYNEERLRYGSFFALDEDTDVIPATVVYESEKDPGEVSIEMMRIIEKAFTQMSPVHQTEASDCYNNLIEAYYNWLNKGKYNKKAQKSIASHYRALLEKINDLHDKLRNMKSHLFLDEFKDELNKLDRCCAILSNSRYEAKGFPTFPGHVVDDRLQLLPPSGKRFHQYIIPAVGMGWSKDRNVLLALLSIYSILSGFAMQNNSEIEFISEIREVKRLIQDFFEDFEINLAYVTNSSLENIYSFQETHEDREKLYKIIRDVIRVTPGFLEFDCKYERKKGTLSFCTQNSVSADEHRVLIYYNSRSKEEEIELPWEFPDYNILPELIFTLYLNAGLWPENLSVYLSKKDFQINRDSKWAIGDGIFRILKAIIDAGVLKLILDKEVKIPVSQEKDANPFSNVTRNVHFLVIPILNRSQRESNRKTQIHEYFYNILESLLAYNRLQRYKETFLHKQVFEDKGLLIESLFDKISTGVRTELGFERFNIQLLERIPRTGITELNERLSQWDQLDSQRKDIVWMLFNQHSKQIYELQEAYEIITGGKSPSKRTLNIISYITDEKQRIFTENLFLSRMMGINAKNPLYKVLHKYREGDYFERKLKSYFEETSTIKALSAMRGGLIKPDWVQGRLLTTANSLRKTAGLTMQIDLKDSPAFSNSEFLVVNIEGKPLNQPTDYSDLFRLFRINIVRYSFNHCPKIIFDEYFLREPRKIPGYDYFIENLLIEACFQTGLPVIVRAKHQPKTGEWIKDKTASIMTQNERAWRKIIEFTKLQDQNHSEIKLWGFVADFVAIPYLNLQGKDSDTRILRLTMPSEFSSEDENVTNKYNVMINLALKGSRKIDSPSDFYAHASALLSFIDEEYEHTEVEEQKTLELLLSGASLGDEFGSLSLKGIERLFTYPYPDPRKMYGPALLLNGVDIIEYDRKDEY